MQSKPPRGILRNKKASSGDQKKHDLIWDEVNLLQNEEEKVPRMKIDEPKTPFHYADGSTRRQASESPQRKRSSSASPPRKKSGNKQQEILQRFDSNELSKIALSRRARDLEDEDEEDAEEEEVEVEDRVQNIHSGN
jgi:hypothetical protein